MTAWLAARFARWLSTYASALAAVPDPHGQFQSVPVTWLAAPSIPEQLSGPPPGHPERLEPR